MINRPHINIAIGTNKKPLITPALIDTGASISVISEDLARRLFQRQGRPYLLMQTTTCVTSATGHGLLIKGQLETKVSGIGVVSFYVVRNLLNHHCIIGWDLLNLYGVDLTSTEITWGGKSFPLVPYSVPELSAIEPIDPIDPIAKIVQKYKQVFGEHDELREARVKPMQIETSGPPIHQRPYRTPLAKREAIDKEIDKMLKMGIIRESSSPWASPVLLVPKKDGELRFCVDYRRVNEVTVKNRYPLPFIQDVFDQLGGARVFTTLDLRSGYHQVSLTEESIQKTAFVCHRGQFEYKRVPFGLSNAPGHFQAAMNQILSRHIGKRVMVFLDDIVIYSKNPSEHASDLELVLKDIQNANLTLKESKCHFGKTELDLLGYVISAEGIRAQPSKTSAIQQLPPPQNIAELRRFLGMSSYYRQLVPEFARIASPLYQLTKKGEPWVWDSKRQNAFNQLKEGLCSNQVMAHPDTSKPYILYTDACDHAIGGILCQEDDDGIERPIQYLSAQLTSTQRKWATIEKECFAVVYCLDKLRCYLLGSDFVVYTDHKPLLSLFTQQMKNTKIQRWGILFEEFGAVIKYRPGANNVRADMLSRIVTQDIAVIDMSTEWVHLENAQHSEFHLYDHLDKEQLVKEQKLEFKNEILSTQEPDSNYIIYNDLLYSCSRTNRFEPRYPRIVLPTSFRKQIIQRCHNETAHSGTIKTMSLVQEGYVWPGMKKEIDNWVKMCPICKVHITLPEKVVMGTMPVAQTPGQIVGLDLIGPLLPSHQGNSYLMVVIDHFSGWIEAYPLGNKSNEAVWEKFRNDYVPRHGSCRVLITDNGAEFKGAEWEEWLRGNRIEHRRTTPYHPQSNGKTERANRTIKSMIKKLINGERSDWEDKLGPALWAIRTSPSVTTGFSPFLLHHARPPRAPISDMLAENDDFTFENRLNLQSEIFREAARATIESRQQNKERIDKKANAKIIQVGDHVILKANEPLSLTAKWDYGYIVTRTNGLTVDLIHPESGATLRVNREKVVLTNPDMAWEEVAPRPRRRRQQVKQVHVPKRRAHHRRDSCADSVTSEVSRCSAHSRASVSSKASIRPRPSTSSGKSANTPTPPRQEDRFVRPTSLPPLSQHRPVKRTREDDTDDSIAKRTRSHTAHTAGVKRSPEPHCEETQPKRWRPEQVSLLSYVSGYFSSLCHRN